MFRNSLSITEQPWSQTVEQQLLTQSGTLHSLLQGRTGCIQWYCARKHHEIHPSQWRAKAPEGTGCKSHRNQAPTGCCKYGSHNQQQIRPLPLEPILNQDLVGSPAEHKGFLNDVLFFSLGLLLRCLETLPFIVRKVGFSMNRAWQCCNSAKPPGILSRFGWKLLIIWSRYFWVDILRLDILQGRPFGPKGHLWKPGKDILRHLLVLQRAWPPGTTFRS